MAAHDLLSYERNWDKKQKRKQLPRNMQQSYEVPAADWALFGKTKTKKYDANLFLRRWPAPGGFRESHLRMSGRPVYHYGKSGPSMVAKSIQSHMKLSTCQIVCRFVTAAAALSVPGALGGA